MDGSGTQRPTLEVVGTATVQHRRIQSAEVGGSDLPQEQGAHSRRDVDAEHPVIIMASGLLVRLLGAHPAVLRRLLPQVQLHGIAWHTPASVHFGTADAIDQDRQNTLTAAYHAHPERFSRRPHPPAMPTQFWINQPELGPQIN